MGTKSYTVSTKYAYYTTTEGATVDQYTGNGMDDGTYSDYIVNRRHSASTIKKSSTSVFDANKRSLGLYKRSDIDLFGRRYRFGLFNPYETLSTTREFLFFTKPDLNIYARNNTSGVLTGSLNENLASLPYWSDLANRYDNVIQCLQSSYKKSEGKNDPFNHLLENTCISNLSIPSLSAETIDTPSNMYGVNFSYRGSSEASNDGFEFDLEFKDTRYLPVYQFFKAYEEYETLKHHGTVGPWHGYIMDKVLHDQFAIYKFLVDEDMETIVYWAKFYGVYPVSLPRDVFSSADFESGLSYSISFKSAFFEDMDPLIFNDFNLISKTRYDSCKYRIDVFNDKLDRMDNRPAIAAYVVSDTTSLAAQNAPGNKIYKLKWRGDDAY